MIVKKMHVLLVGLLIETSSLGFPDIILNFCNGEDSQRVVFIFEK